MSESKPYRHRVAYPVHHIAVSEDEREEVELLLSVYRETCRHEGSEGRWAREGGVFVVDVKMHRARRKVA